MSINGINRSGPLRMMGLSSGMDTDFIIQQTLKMHQLRIDQRTRARTLVDWRLQAHNSIRSDINSFRNSFLTTLGANAMISSSVFNTSRATFNSSAISIRTPIGFPSGKMTINSITSLAKGAHITSKADNLHGSNVSANTSMGGLRFGIGDVKVGDQINVNGVRVTIPAQTTGSTQTYAETFLNAVNDANRVNFSNITNTTSVYFNTGTHSTKVEFSASESLADIADKINIARNNFYNPALDQPDQLIEIQELIDGAEFDDGKATIRVDGRMIEISNVAGNVTNVNDVVNEVNIARAFGFNENNQGSATININGRSVTLSRNVIDDSDPPSAPRQIMGADIVERLNAASELSWGSTATGRLTFNINGNSVQLDMDDNADTILNKIKERGQGLQFDSTIVNINGVSVRLNAKFTIDDLIKAYEDAKPDGAPSLGNADNLSFSIGGVNGRRIDLERGDATSWSNVGITALFDEAAKANLSVGFDRTEIKLGSHSIGSVSVNSGSDIQEVAKMIERAGGKVTKGDDGVITHIFVPDPNAPGSTGALGKMGTALDITDPDLTTALLLEHLNGTDANYKTDVQKFNEMYGRAPVSGNAEDNRILSELASNRVITIYTGNEKTVEINRSDSINTMVSKINSAGAGVSMSYDQINGTFTLETNQRGEQMQPGQLNAIDRDPGTFFGLLLGGGVAKVGSDAVMSVSANDGTAQTFTSKTNTFDDVFGVSITATSKTDAPIDINFSRNTDDAFNKIKTFVDAYNSLVSRLEGLVRDRKTTQESSYRPLTDEEKSLMSEKQIEEWEAIAKKGILRNDAGLQRLTSQLRGALFESVQAAGLSPSEIGLSTGSFFGGTGGQIVLNEDRLRAALDEDPERVMNVFMGDAGNRGGLLYRMDDILRNYTSNSQRDSINNIENSLRRHNEQIERLQLKMFKEEERLYKMFAAMETAMSRMQSQGDWFTAMMGSMQ